MNPTTRDRALYGVLTALFLLPTAGSGAVELFTAGPESVRETLALLGYPPYLMKILGAAKLLGAAAIVAGRWPRLTEWAYAGFTFMLLGAAASHGLAGDGAHAPVPLMVLGVMLGSYAMWRRRQAVRVGAG